MGCNHSIVPTKGRLAARHQNCKANAHAKNPLPPGFGAQPPETTGNEPAVDSDKSILGPTLLAAPISTGFEEPSKHVTSSQNDDAVDAPESAHIAPDHVWTPPVAPLVVTTSQHDGLDAAQTAPGASPAEKGADVEKAGSDLSREDDEQAAALSNAIALGKERVALSEAASLGLSSQLQGNSYNDSTPVVDGKDPVSNDQELADGPCECRGPCGCRTCAAIDVASIYAACRSESIGGLPKTQVQLPFGIVTRCCPAARQNSIDELCFCSSDVGLTALDDRPEQATSKPHRQEEGPEQMLGKVRDAHTELIVGDPV